MNWADLSTLLIVLTTTLTGAVAARSKGGPWWMVLCAAVLGLLMGLGIGWLSGRTAYAFLTKASRDRRAMLYLAVYLLAPMAFLVVGLICTGMTVDWLVGCWRGR